MAINRRGESKVVVLVALGTMLVVGLACLGVTYMLAKSGALDSWLRQSTATATSPAVAQLPTITPSPSMPLVMTATPPQATVTLQPTLTPTRVILPSATPLPPSPSPSPTVDPQAALRGKYLVEYLGCIPHGQSIGTVKGQVFDSNGQIVVGAEVFVTLNDWAYDTPGRTNEAGWYEFYLEENLKVKIVLLRFQGQEMPLIDHDKLEFHARGGCFEHVNLRQQ